MDWRKVGVWGAALVGMAALLFGQVATQVVAAAYRYHPGLTWRVGEAAGRTWYAPWAYLAWRETLGSRDPAVFAKGKAVAVLVVVVVGLVVAAVVRVVLRRGGSDTYGTARWATRRELKEKGLLADGNGVVLCQTSEAQYVERNGDVRMVRAGAIIKDDGPAHTMVFARSRSGKGVGCVLPTAASWIGSAVILDVKGEIWEASSGFRGQLGPCIRFDPTARDSAGYNPLAEVRKGDCEVRDAQALAAMIMDPTGEKEPDYWQNAGMSLLTGVLLHVLYAEADKSPAGALAFLTDPNRSQFDTLERMLRTKHLGSGTHPVVASAAKEVINKAPEELSGVISAVTSKLGLFRDPLVARATSTSSFRITDLMQGRYPVSLYLVVPPGDKKRLQPLVRLMVDQIGRRLLESFKEGASRRHPLLLLLDEVALLGRLSFLEEGMPVFAGYGIKALLILQDLKQLQAAYTDKESLSSNCAVKMAFGIEDVNTAELVSKMLGTATVTKRNVSLSGTVMGPKNQSSVSQQDHQRPLLTAGEVMTLPDDEALLFVSGMAPYRGKKIRFFTDKRLKSRLGMPPLAGENEMRRRMSAEHPWTAEGVKEPSDS